MELEIWYFWAVFGLVSLLIIIHRIVVNHAHLKTLMRFYALYERYISTHIETPEAKELGESILQHQSRIIELFQKAGLTSSIVGVVQPVGFGRVLEAKTSVWENIANRREDIVLNIYGHFHRAIGHFRTMRNDGFSPLFWFEQFGSLPKNIVNWFGVDEHGVVGKLIQMIVVAAEFVAALVTIATFFR